MDTQKKGIGMAKERGRLVQRKGERLLELK